MEKIKQLMLEAGLSDQAVSQICEALENYRTDIRAQYEEEYAAKVTRAKEVCESEVESHKRSLERRLQIFCESKSAEIDRVAAKQAAERESEAIAKLTSIQNLLEGIETNGQPNGQLEAQVKKLKVAATKLEEQRKLAVSKANQQTQLAEKVLKRNRELERRTTQPEVSEGQEETKTIAEGKEEKGQKRLDRDRQSGTPKTTRRTLKESQDRRPPDSSKQPVGEMRSPYSPDEIANLMEEDLT